MKKLLSCLTGVLLALSVALVALAAPLYIAGTNAGWMHGMLLRHAPEEATGLPESEYQPVAQMITSFLAGRTDEFQHTFTAKDGVTYFCFDTHEQAHMADCAGLFRLCRTVLIVSTGVLLCAAGAAVWQKRALQRILAAALWTFAALIFAIVLIAVWAMIDFDALFILFHQISFTNDLWLLNPATDLLIRLMPTSFFMEYAAFCGGSWLLICTGCAAAAIMLRRKLPPDTNRGT